MQPPAGGAGLGAGLGTIPGAVPNVMGDYLEKSASSVISMQEELRKQAMQMFSAFPFASPANASANSNPSDADTDDEAAAAEPARGGKSGAAKSTAVKAAPKSRAKKAGSK